MKTGWLKILFVLLTFSAFATNACAQVAKMQALYLFQFAKNIGWPAADADKNFVVVVMGDAEVAHNLATIAENKKIGNRAIEIVEVRGLSNITEGDILFVASSRKSQVASAASFATKRKMLLVSGEGGECANGASISFCDGQGGKLGFEISERNIKKSGLNVTPKLLNLGKSVD